VTTQLQLINIIIITFIELCASVGFIVLSNEYISSLLINQLHGTYSFSKDERLLS